MLTRAKQLLDEGAMTDEEMGSTFAAYLEVVLAAHHLRHRFLFPDFVIFLGCVHVDTVSILHCRHRLPKMTLCLPLSHQESSLRGWHQISLCLR